MKMWKRFATIVGFCAAAVVLAGCVQEETETEEEKETVVLWHYWDQGASKRVLWDAADEFNSLQDDVVIEIRYVPDEDFKKQLALSIADGTMPALALVDSSDFMYFHEMQAFVDLTDEIEGIEDYLPQAKASCEIDGRMDGMPYGLECAVLYYNESLLEEAGLKVPQTWDELYEAALELFDGSRYGFALPAVQSEESVFAFLPFFWSAGGDLADINAEEGSRAFSFLRQLADSGAMSMQTINMTTGDLAAQFADGNIAMMINASHLTGVISERSPELEFDITCPPVYEEGGEYVTTLGGEVFCVTDGEQQEAAIAFLQFFAEKEQMTEALSGTGHLAPRQDILEKQTEESSIQAKVWEIMQYARQRDFSTNWPYISQAVTEAMSEEIIGQEDEADILAHAAEEIEESTEGSE